MSVESHLQDLFSNDTNISALVGAGTASRIYFMEARQGTEFPAVVITNVGGPRFNHLKGPDGHARIRMQIDCYAKTVTELKDETTGLVPAIRRALSSYRGRRKGTGIQSCIFINSRDMPVDEIKGYRVLLEYSIWHTEDNSAP